jgi:hypothetical protein
VAFDEAEAVPRRIGNKKLIESFMIAVAVWGSQFATVGAWE